MARTGLEKLSVLIVDDHASMRHIVSTILHAFGINTVIEAVDGSDAIEAMRSHQPDMIILDWEMPGIDGVEFTELIRKANDSPHPFVPIIFLTSYSDKRHVIEARDAGVNEFLAKPVSAKAIYDRLMAIIYKPRPFVRSKSYFGPCRRRRVNPDYNGPERRNPPVIIGA